MHYAHRTPIRKSLTTGEKKALENVLKDLDSGTFQLFDENNIQNPTSLFQALCQYPVDATQITLPSFFLIQDSYSFIYPIKVLGKKIKGMDLDANSLNQKMSDWSFRVQEVINNLNSQRAGKIFDLVIGPFASNEKQNILSKLFAQDFNFNEIGELNLTFAYYRNIGDETFNIQTAVLFLQQKLEDSFFINLKIDINNRNLVRALEPSQIKIIWDKADNLIKEHLGNILNLT